MALFGVNSMTVIIFSSRASDTDSRTKRLSRKKSWGSRLLKCCSVSSTLKAVRKTNSQNDLGYCSLLNCKFIFHRNRKIATRLTFPFGPRRHRQNCHRGKPVNTEMHCSGLLFPHKLLFDCPPVPFHSASLKEELKDLKETSLFEEERVKAVLQGLRR